MTTPQSEILDRLPPQDLAAEVGVLGSILLKPLVCDDVALELTADEFYVDGNRRLYAVMQGMHNEGKRIDITLLTSRLKEAGELEAIGGPSRLAELMNEVPVSAHAVHYAKIVRKKATLRALIHASTEVLRDAYDPTIEPRELQAKAEQHIFEVGDRHTDNRVQRASDVLMDAMTQIDRAMGGDGPPRGVTTGFPDLDRITGGLRNNALTILAARPSAGKTALALNIADHVAIESESPTIVVSLEMDNLEMVLRMLSSRSGIDGHKMSRGDLTVAERQTIVEVNCRMARAPLLLDETATRTVSEIAAVARRQKRKEGLGLLIVDYLQLIQPENPRDPRQEQVSKIARRLKGLARELSVPVLALSQLNRQVESRTDPRPKLSDLRESGAIEQDADVVMFIHRQELYQDDDQIEAHGTRGKAELLIRKQRNGPTGVIHLTWRKEITKFESAAVQERYDEFNEFEQP